MLGISIKTGLTFRWSRGGWNLEEMCVGHDMVQVDMVDQERGINLSSQ
jgi:hypothetical protein